MLANVMGNAFLVKYDKIASNLSPGYTKEEISYLLNSGQDRVFFTLYNPLSNKFQQGFEMSEKRDRDLAELIRFVNILGNVNTNQVIYYLATTSNPYIYTIINTTTKGLAEGVKLYNSKTYIDGLPNNAISKVVSIISDTQIRVDSEITSTITLESGSEQLAVLSGLGKSKSQVEVHIDNGIKGVMLDLPPLYLYTVEETVKTSESLGYTPVKVVTHDYIRANMRNPYKKPNIRINWRTQFSKSIHGIGDEDNSTLNGIEQFESSNKRVEVITNGSELQEYWCRYLKMPRRIVIDEDFPELQVSCELDESIHEMIIDEAVKIAVGITNPEMYQVKVNERTTSE